MKILAADVEGVFLPEIWINVAKKTKIKELELTTRDISDYDKLMTGRLAILKENNLKLRDIKDVIASMEPLKGALDTLNWIRKLSQIILLSDTFEEFAKPLLAKLNFPTLFCNSLTIDKDGNIIDYNIRIKNQKKQAVKVLKQINYHVIAFGDSYNDIDMIKEADYGFFFQPPDPVKKDFPDIPVIKNYHELKIKISSLLNL